MPAGLGDLAAVGLGFGALLLEGSYVYRKGCHGASVARFTDLGCAELAIAFALFVAMGQHPERRARGALGTTQRALFNDAMVWAKSNLAIVQGLHKSPARVAAGEFRLMEPRPWLSRLFGSGRPAKDVSLPGPDASLDEIEAALAGANVAERPARKPDPELDEIKKLVDEALSEVEQAADTQLSH